MNGQESITRLSSLEIGRTAASASLTSLCLGRDPERESRWLAWGCSISALFLVVGLSGINRQTPPPSHSDQPRQIVPVVFTAVPATSSAGAELPAAEPRPVTEARNPPPLPVVAVVGPQVGSEAPVSAATLLTPAAQAPLPPVPSATATQAVTRFNPGTADTPQPDYPGLALRRGYEGTVVVQFTVAASGRIEAAQLGQSSGFAVLDDAALETVKNRWRFPPGAVRHHFVEIVFQLK